ncbi:MAG: hypothetical protein ACFFFK_07685 [Candidatus Thorarchaeota archaeon]
MTSKEFTTELELYGTSPGVIAIFLIIATLMIPSGMIPSGTSPYGTDWYIYSLLWIYSSGGLFGGGFRAFNMDLFLTLPLCILNVVFAIWIIRYYQAKTTKYTAMTIGLLSVLLPTILVLYFSGLVVIVYPLPIQFIIGLLILWRIEGPEVISPWSGMRLDLSWWSWKSTRRPKRKVTSDGKSLVEKEEWLGE